MPIQTFYSTITLYEGRTPQQKGKTDGHQALSICLVCMRKTNGAVSMYIHISGGPRVAKRGCKNQCAERHHFVMDISRVASAARIWSG